MTDSGPRKIGVSIDVKPHAYDPFANPELFEGVLARRSIAFLIDVVIIAIPLVFAAVFIFVLGIVTFGLGWGLFWLLSPGWVIWAICYYGMTFVPVTWWLSRVRRAPYPVDEATGSGIVGRAMRTVTAVESRAPAPIGTSLVGLARPR